MGQLQVSWTKHQEATFLKFLLPDGFPESNVEGVAQGKFFSPKIHNEYSQELMKQLFMENEISQFIHYGRLGINWMHNCEDGFCKKKTKKNTKMRIERIRKFNSVWGWLEYLPFHMRKLTKPKKKGIKNEEMLWKEIMCIYLLRVWVCSNIV